MAQCEFTYHYEESSPHPTYVCRSQAVVAVEFSYRNGEYKQTANLCDLHATNEISILNSWGRSYGHSAKRIAQ